MAMKTPNEKTKKKPVNPYAASLNGYKHLSSRAEGRKVISKPKAIKVNGKVVPLPKNATAGSTPKRPVLKGKGATSKPRNPITSIGAYIGKSDWAGTKDMKLNGVSTTGQLKVGDSAKKSVKKNVKARIKNKSSAGLLTHAFDLMNKAKKKK